MQLKSDPNPTLDLERLLAARRWGEAVLAARRRLSADPRDAAAWAGMAGALAGGLREPEAAYTAYGRALAALEQQPQQQRRMAGGGDRQGWARDLATQRLECLAAVARADSNAVRARWERSGLAAAGAAAGGASGAPRGTAAPVARAGDGGARPRVFVLSDLHADTSSGGGGTHMELLRRISGTRFRRDVLLVAGDVADTLPATREALRLLKERFGRVFYVPGNHCLWLRPGLEAGAASLPDSLSKLWALLAACDELGVETVAAEVAPGLAVAPLQSWYNAAFDERDPRPGRYRFDSWCRWPVSDLDVWQLMLRLNDATLAAVDAWRQRRQAPTSASSSSTRFGSDGNGNACAGSFAGAGAGGDGPPPAASAGLVVISMSHFLPHPSLPFPRLPAEMAKAVGCRELLLLLDRLGSDVHVYGHTHMPYDGSLPAPGPLQPSPAAQLRQGQQQRRDDGGGGDGAGGAGGDEGPAAGRPSTRRYVHWPLQGQSSGRALLRCIWDGAVLCCQDVDVDGATAGE
ncbi:hypothetical protein GPECTOR_10g1056 [Gonium pectorale]|uniref:Calcineurin-like phosphoesterase domain-containing protein n=1 Tax=Gonium pectorale TaxID=33097 RepID=A0A150GQH5_GONPE|nr:hypothetical protein GPECTOR_10g1056 [Gonium pectorale]|eukprot:KXZ52033.1 hypothetical protein GPECTOR_10g1056 [Gonium pectorale]